MWRFCATFCDYAHELWTHAELHHWQVNGETGYLLPPPATSQHGASLWLLSPQIIRNALYPREIIYLSFCRLQRSAYPSLGRAIMPAAECERWMRSVDPVPFLILSTTIQAAMLGELCDVLGIREEYGRIPHRFWKAL